jgi:hypothetical protein
MSAAQCWFCGDVVVHLSPMSKSHDGPWPVGNAMHSQAGGDAAARGVEVGLATLTVLALAICGAGFWINTGLGFTATLLVAPALIQTRRAVRREEARGKTVGAIAKFGAFVRSLLLGIAARAAGFATLLIVSMIGFTAGQFLSLFTRGIWPTIVFTVIGAALGAVAGFWVALKINRQQVTV